jgi:hypothetical protein
MKRAFALLVLLALPLTSFASIVEFDIHDTSGNKVAQLTFDNSPPYDFASDEGQVTRNELIGFQFFGAFADYTNVQNSRITLSDNDIKTLIFRKGGTTFDATSFLAKVTGVPEPRSLALLGIGLLGFALMRLRRRAAV